MSEYTRRNEADELRKQLSICYDYIAILEAECKELKEKLREMDLVVEHNRQVANEEHEHLKELRYRDGIIEGLKFAIKCNGVNGGEVS